MFGKNTERTVYLRGHKQMRVRGESPNLEIETGGGEWRPATTAEQTAIEAEVLAVRILERDILSNQSALVEELIRKDFEGFGVDDISLYVNPGDWDEDQCREYLAEFGELPADGDEPDDLDGWHDLVSDCSQDNPKEPLQWFLVTSWLSGHLKELGEVVIDNDYGRWWGRCTCGQGIILDGILQAVAKRCQ
jgi:hypothetical protein